MSNAILYPRLPAHVATRLFIDIKDLDVHALQPRVAFRHADAIYAATGGPLVSDTAIQTFRTAMLQVAQRYGFPENSGSRQLSEFDAEAALKCHASLPISGGEAARDEVWSFLTIVVAPDLARWRFRTSGEERFRGGVRNVFQRLWWRAEALVDPASNDALERLRRMPEDAMVGIMERPGISSNPRIARSIVSHTLALSSKVPTGRFEDAYRSAYKRIRQIIPVLCLDSLDEAQLASCIGSIFHETAESYQ